MPKNQGAIDRSRSDGNVVALIERRQKLVRFLNWCGKICVREKCDPPASFHHSVPHTVSLATVLTVWHEAKRRHLARPFLSDRRSTILRAVVHDNNFHLAWSKCPAGKVVANFREAARKASFLVVSWDDDGEIRGVRHTHPWDGSCSELGDGHP
jgi:hypothetical protein